MSTENPYQPPAADLSKPFEGDTDRTSVFSPAGRFGRLSYIAWGALLYLAVLAVMALLAAAGLWDPTAQSGGITQALVGVPAAAVGFLFGIRRLHDMNATGWWILLSLVPLVNIGLALVLFLKAGAPGANRFAPPRPTPTWERILGIVGAVLMALSLVAMLIALLVAMVAGLQSPT